MKKIDYGKILFIGVPLSFMVWVVSLLSLGATMGGSDTTFHLSYVVTGIFAVVYFIFSVARAKKVGAVIVEPDPNDPIANAKRPLSTGQMTLAAIFVIFMFGSLAVAIIGYGVPSHIAFRNLLPIFVILAIGERIYLKRKVHNQSLKRDDETAGVQE